ncbi:MAG: HAD-IIA family hydrolase [Oscillospiraceae bacterium]|jgi:HAD superfamily hydrolase (TIGR01450 family)|nr:HAD-IIA family hydrolase [Oscillospiraceae bacterium]
MPKHPLFQKSKCFVFDMDGTIYLGEKLIDGADDLLCALPALGYDYRLFSNNSSNSIRICQTRLAGMGIDVGTEKIILSSHVAADYLRKNHAGKKVYLLGNEHLRAIIQDADVCLTDETERPDIVLLGFDTTLTYQKIAYAAKSIAGGALYLATHPDVNCPTADGFLPDTGAMIAMFEASTGKRPLVMGKPTQMTVTFLQNELGLCADQLVFVGDRLETDIAIGANHGIPSVLVLSGVTTAEQAAHSAIKADFTLANAACLKQYLE